MNPAFSVIFLTTLIGMGQGLFIALFVSEALGPEAIVVPASFHVIGSGLSVLLMVAGLAASFFHLGHPERAWRAAAMWRTSWLSREVIVLPITIALVAIYGALHTGPIGAAPEAIRAVGWVSLIATLALFACTAMIYAGIRFLQEWATPLTMLNFSLLGSASGFTLATALAHFLAPGLTAGLGWTAAALGGLGFITRAASLVRNRRLKPKSTLQSAIGVRHPNIVQKSQGFMGGSFNTREFFHGVPRHRLRHVRWIFLLLFVPLPLGLLALGVGFQSAAALILAVAVQSLGLVAERWFFFAEANHPQNLYYQTVS